MPYAEGRTYHDADAHIMEEPGWLPPFAEPAVRDRMKPVTVSTVKPGEETFIDDDYSGARRSTPHGQDGDDSIGVSPGMNGLPSSASRIASRGLMPFLRAVER